MQGRKLSMVNDANDREIQNYAVRKQELEQAIQQVSGRCAVGCVLFWVLSDSNVLCRRRKTSRTGNNDWKLRSSCASRRKNMRCAVMCDHGPCL